MTAVPTLNPTTVRPTVRRRARLAGRVDSHVVADVVATIEEAAGTSGDVVVDMRDVRFLDLHALRAIADCSARIAARGDHLVLGAVSTAAAVILDLVGTAGLVELPATGLAVAA